MKYTLLLLCFLILVITSESFSGVNYDPPEGGWIYVYDGVELDIDPFSALDGLWDHEAGSDMWDGSEIGFDSPGGISALQEVVGEDTTKFIRIQDTGDPTQYGITDPSNRKEYLTYNINLNDALGNESTLLDDGITISFRTRIVVDNNVDKVHPSDGSGIDVWSETGDGYVLHDGGKGNFTVYQQSGGEIAFCLAVKSDHEYLEDFVDDEGLIMNHTNGNTIGANTDWQGTNAADITDDMANLLSLDPREWHEFWITIQAANALEGTHIVNIYKDGKLDPTEFIVTAGSGLDHEGQFAYIAMGCGSTPQSGCFDVDFYAYIDGVHTPTTTAAVQNQKLTTPTGYELAQNYPNPFNPTTKINYVLPKNGHVTLTVYDIMGRQVRTLVDEYQTNALYSCNFSAQGLSNGVYFYELKVDDNFIAKRKMVIMK